jgi:hypothetical protein
VFGIKRDDATKRLKSIGEPFLPKIAESQLNKALTWSGSSARA